MKPSQVENRLTRLLHDAEIQDGELLKKLQELEASPYISAFTWKYGVRLYARSRRKFRAFILAHFDVHSVKDSPEGPVYSLVKWDGPQGKDLQAWLDAVDMKDDILLTRQLLMWKAQSLGWRQGREFLAQELVARIKAAQSTPVRELVLAKFDLWMMQLDEQTAIKIYRTAMEQTRPFILKHMPFMWPGWGGERVLWRHMYERAVRKNDTALADEIYKRQVPMAKWERDSVEVAAQIKDVAQLTARLRKTEPVGAGADLKHGLLKLLQARGKDALPYVTRAVHDAGRGWQDKHQAPYLEIAKANKWWDLWAEVTRVPANDAVFCEQVEWLLASAEIPALVKRSLLGMLANVGKDAGHAGLGLPRPVTLSDKTATTVYKLFPEILRGPLRQTLNYHAHGVARGYTQLITELGSKSDGMLLDHLAHGLLTAGFALAASSKKPQNQKAREDLDRLTGYFKALQEKDSRVFAIRCACVLSLMKPSEISDLKTLLVNNPLAHLLIERPVSSYLEASELLGDLVETGNRHVRDLAYKALATDDKRAREAAVKSVDVLVGVLFLAMDARSRRVGLKALANAGVSDLEAARVILPRAREAMDMPGRDYPRKDVAGLMGQLLGTWPELAGERDAVLIYRRQAKVGA
jgi:hypothetical protein